MTRDVRDGAIDDLWRLEISKALEGVDPVTGPRTPGARLRFSLAAVGALMALVRTILGTLPDPARLPVGARRIAALHGEIANRTIHLIAALAAEAPATPILLLGRPKGSLAQVRVAFRERGLAEPLLVRPWSLTAALAALPDVVRDLARGAPILEAVSPPLALREQTAIAFRMALGAVSERWARSAGEGVEAAVFGHTGLADTSLLERGLQACGARTVHWVHGVTQGWNFTGRSDLALFQCESDARWHAALGGYGAVRALPAVRPAPIAGGQGWLLLSNLAHPMNPSFQAHGVRAEIDLLRAVAEAASEAGAAVTWKPHPVLYDLAPAVRDPVMHEARRLGLVEWDRADRSLAGAARFATVISTPSTAALDVLRLGGLPIIFGLGDTDPAAAVAKFPIHATDARGLVEAASRLSDPAARSAAFESAWRAIGPGRTPRLEDLFGALAAG
jgi:hypothetical protein